MKISQNFVAFSEYMNFIDCDLASIKTFQYGPESLSTMHQGAVAVAVHLASCGYRVCMYAVAI